MQRYKYLHIIVAGILLVLAVRTNGRVPRYEVDSGDVQPHHKMTVEYVPLGDLMYQIRKRQPVLDDDEFGWSWVIDGFKEVKLSSLIGDEGCITRPSTHHEKNHYCL